MTDPVTPTPPEVRYSTIAIRPAMHVEGAFHWDSVGSIWPDRESCENHVAYCEGKAEQDPERYGDVRYAVVEVRIAEESS